MKYIVTNCSEWTKADKLAGIQAKVDDESYLNAYFAQYFPTVTLSSGFTWTVAWEFEWWKHAIHMGTATHKDWLREEWGQENTRNT